MVNRFTVDNQKTVVCFGKLFYLNFGVLGIVAFQIKFNLLGNISTENNCFHMTISFCQQCQHAFINVIID